MASTLETALVFPLSFALLLSFSALVFPVYRQIRDDVQTDLPELRAAASGSEAYRAYRNELGNPYLESHVDAYKDDLLMLQDNAHLFKRFIIADEQTDALQTYAAIKSNGDEP